MLPRLSAIPARHCGTWVVVAMLAIAWGAPPASEREYLSEIPIVVSATRLSQRITDTPVAVTVIDRALIERTGAVHLVDVLRLVPGFQVGHTAGNLFTATAHGTGSPWFARLQILVDGQSRYHTTFSGIDWVNLGVALADVERVEVVRGPNISTYGDNAIMGTVNIVTRQPFQVRGLFLQATGGGEDWAQGVLRQAGRLGPMDYRLTLEHRRDQGFADVDDHTRLTNPSFRGIVDLTPQDELDIHLGYTESDLGVTLQFEIPRDSRRVTSDYQFLRWTHATDSDRGFYVQFTRDHYDTREDTRVALEALSAEAGVPPALAELLLGPLDQTVAFNNFNGNSTRYELELRQSLRPLDDLRLTWGGGYRWESMRDDQLGTSERLSANTATLSANLEWRPDPRWLANLGALLESNTVIDDTALSPRLGINYRLTPKQTFRVAVTRAQQFPSLLQEHWNALISLDDGTPFAVNYVSPDRLALETREQVEVGYLGRLQNDRLDVDARLYHEDVDDAVTYTYDLACPQQPLFALGCYRLANALDYRVTGLETTLSYRPAAGTFARFTYAYADTHGTAPATLNPVSEIDLARTVPRHSGTLLLSQTLASGIEGSIAAYYMDDLYWFNDAPASVDDYFRVDLRLAKAFNDRGAHGQLELLVHGLGGTYAEFTPRNRFEPRLYLRASLQLD